MNRLKKISLLSSGLLLLPVIALAQITPDPPGALRGSIVGQPTTAGGLIQYIINLGLLIVGLLSVAFLIYGGFRYITSAGDSEIAEGAKRTIQNSLIGLAIVILSYVIITVIINALVQGRVN